LETISEILDQNQDVLDRILVDLTNSRRKDTGRKGLNAEQVLRICVLKQFRALSYEELAFHLEDSQVFRRAPGKTVGTYSRIKVKDVVFAKKRGLSVLDMAKSSWVYKKLRNFRAGIEANISTLKRAFGLNRCTWKSWKGFCRYVWSSIVAYNPQVMARIKLAAA
jgi:IS5 family transposase